MRPINPPGALLVDFAIACGDVDSTDDTGEAADAVRKCSRFCFWRCWNIQASTRTKAQYVSVKIAAANRTRWTHLRITLSGVFLTKTLT